MSEPRWLEVDLSRLDANLAWWRELLRRAARADKPALLCGVVKANAYGLGAVAIAQRLAQRGIDMLAVYSPAQADELFRARIAGPVLVLNPMRELPRTDVLCQAAADGKLHLTVNDPEQLDMIEAVGRSLGCAMPVHLHLDTGMSRAGLSPEGFHATLLRLAQLSYVRLAGVCTHFATAGDDPGFAYEQLARLDRVLEAHRAQIPPEAMVHVGATAAACRDACFHRHMVRIGIGLYGHGPELLEGGSSLCGEAGPLPIVRWLANVVHVQRYTAGTTVGYGCTARLTRDSVLGVVPVGYADGYPLALSNRGLVRLVAPAAVGDADVPRYAPVVGKVSMDQLVIDLTDVPQAGLSTVVELIGNDPAAPNALRRVAAAAGTTCYEMLTRLSPRLPRRYVSVEVAKARLGRPGDAPARLAASGQG